MAECSECHVPFENGRFTGPHADNCPYKSKTSASIRIGGGSPKVDNKDKKYLFLDRWPDDYPQPVGE